MDEISRMKVGLPFAWLTTSDIINYVLVHNMPTHMHLENRPLRSNEVKLAKKQHDMDGLVRGTILSK